MKFGDKKSSTFEGLNNANFSHFLVINHRNRVPTERKNDFHDKIILKTRSATSNYP